MKKLEITRKRRHTHTASPKTPKTPISSSFPQEQNRGGLLVTDELDKAIEECKSRVAEIAADCRKRNRKFRDIEFDIEYDKERCLKGLQNCPYEPSDVQRVTQIFQKPSFFIDGADSDDIVQGALHDCWFLSALSTMSTMESTTDSTMSTNKRLVEKICVERDEQVGVYGFIFFRDTTWVTVIVDDLLFTSIPKFEELAGAEKQLYHHDKEAFNKSARKNGKSLYFAKSGTDGETWVPLIEKAYAKLHGNYASLDSGQAGEAIEDLTGGVTSFIFTKDILDPEVFWTNELLRANTDRLFSCSFDDLSTTRSGTFNLTVKGLMGAHAYSVLRAVEYKRKRFIVIRNPWGRSEWTGPWSDGSKEWTSEWLSALEMLKHAFGDDGQFVMEYNDFLENWAQIDRTLLFDSSWTMSSQWLKVTAPPVGSPWAYGDVSFTISLPAPSSVVIVLSKLDDRYWGTMSDNVQWTFDFIVYKKGGSKPITTSSTSLRFSRSVNSELDLEAGEYVVHVRLDRNPGKERTIARFLMEKVKSQSIASNFDAAQKIDHLPVPLDFLAGYDLSELESKALSQENNQLSTAEGQKTEQETMKPASRASNDPSTDAISTPGEEREKRVVWEGGDNGERHGGEEQDGEGADKEENEESKIGGLKDGQKAGEDEDGGLNGDSDDIDEDEDEVYLGLRVYTKKAAPAKVGGQLRCTSEPLASLASKFGKNNQKGETMRVDFTDTMIHL